jgi:hypothetical protein
VGSKLNLSYLPFATIDALDRMMTFLEYLVEPIDNEVSHTNRGISFMHSGFPNDAKDSFDAALEVNPGFVAACSGLAEIVRAQGRPQYAIALEMRNL